MRYIKYFKESSEYDELKEQVELYIVDLIDKGFQVFCEVDHNKTYDYIDLTIRPPYDNFKPYDEQDYFYWNDVKDNIIVLTKIIQKDYYLSEVGVHLENSTPCVLDSSELIDLEDLSVFYTDSELKGHALGKVVLYLVKNK